MYQICPILILPEISQIVFRLLWKFDIQCHQRMNSNSGYCLKLPLVPPQGLLFLHSHFPWDVLQKSGNFLTLHLAPPSRQHLYQIKPHTKTSVQSWVSISKTNSVFYSRKAFLSVNDYGDTLCITMYNAPEHQNITGTIYRASVTSPTQPQSVHPAAIWQQTQKYLLLYHQTTEQLYSTNLLL